MVLFRILEFVLGVAGIALVTWLVAVFIRKIDRKINQPKDK